jgi:hypothetical protein
VIRRKNKSAKYYVKVGRGLQAQLTNWNYSISMCNMSNADEKHMNIHVLYGTNPGICTCFKLHGH